MSDNKCLFLGSKEIGAKCLSVIKQISPESIVACITIDDRNDTRSCLDEFINLTSSIPIHVLKHPSELSNLIIAYQPDLVFVCGWYWIIRKELLSVPKHGFVGFHFSLLPKYRGGAPVVWAIMNGEQETGFSLYRFEDGIDTGPVFAQDKVNISSDNYVNEVLLDIEKKALSSLENKYVQLLHGELSPKPQIGIPTYCAQRLPCDGKIDLALTQHQIYNFIRAQSCPYPGAFVYMQNQKLMIWRAELDERTYYCTPGQIVAFENDNALVGCGDNKVIVLTDMQIEGDNTRATPKEIIKTINTRL